jgi:hypothetical protein
VVSIRGSGGSRSPRHPLRHMGISEQDVSSAEAFAVFAFSRLLSVALDALRPGGLASHEQGAPAPHSTKSSSCSTNVTSCDRGTNDNPPVAPKDGTGPTPGGSDDR